MQSAFAGTLRRGVSRQHTKRPVRSLKSSSTKLCEYARISRIVSMQWLQWISGMKNIGRNLDGLGRNWMDGRCWIWVDLGSQISCLRIDRVSNVLTDWTPSRINNGSRYPGTETVARHRTFFKHANHISGYLSYKFLS